MDMWLWGEHFEEDNDASSEWTTKARTPKQNWKRQVEENLKKIGLRAEEATDRVRGRAIAEGMRCIRPPSDTRKNQIKIG